MASEVKYFRRTLPATVEGRARSRDLSPALSAGENRAQQG